MLMGVHVYSLVCTITPEQWKLILAYKVRGMVLYIAQSEGVQGVVVDIGFLF